MLKFCFVCMPETKNPWKKTPGSDQNTILDASKYRFSLNLLESTG